MFKQELNSSGLNPQISMNKTLILSKLHGHTIDSYFVYIYEAKAGCTSLSVTGFSE